MAHSPALSLRLRALRIQVWRVSECPIFYTARPISYTGVFVSERTMGPLPVCHTDIGALLPAYGMSPSLECDSGHHRAFPNTVPYSVTDTHMLSAVISLVDPVRFFSDSDHLKTKPHLMIAPPTHQRGLSPYRMH